MKNHDSAASILANIERFNRLKKKGMEEMSKFSDWERAVEEEKQKFGEKRLAEKIAELPAEDDLPKPCPRCKKLARLRKKNCSRSLLTLNGEQKILRNGHYCERCRSGFYPRDVELGLPEDGDMSLDLEARVADFVVNDPFDQSEARWELHYPSMPLSSNAFRQVLKRLGVMAHDANPVILQGALRNVEPTSTETLYVATDGSMIPMRDGSWKEAKVGVMFRKEHHTSNKEQSRGVVSEARYVATMESNDRFKDELDVAIQLEKGTQAKEVVWLGDGAVWNWSLASELCPSATQILDWYHAVENGMKPAKTIFGEGHPLLSLWKKTLEHHLMNGNFIGLLRELEECQKITNDAKEIEMLASLIGYYKNNRERMQYDEFRAKGYLIGSGIVESAHRHVLQCRMKRAGQHWGIDGARRMTRLRAAYRTCGPKHFQRSIRWAHRASMATPLARKKPMRASNRG